ADQAESLLPVAGLDHLVAVARQEGAEDLADVRLVIGDQDASRFRHGGDATTTGGGRKGYPAACTGCVPRARCFTASSRPPRVSGNMGNRPERMRTVGRRQLS